MKATVFFLCIILSIHLCKGQLQVKIGNDTTFCSENIEQGVQLAPHLVVTGGTAPYQYCWSISSPYEYLQGKLYYASNLLNDTTLANPVFLNQYVNDPQMWTKFILTVGDNDGNIAMDSINIRFSEYYAYPSNENIIYINMELYSLKISEIVL